MVDMRLLVLGGSWFLGRSVVTDALARGWTVTTFNRGRSGDPIQGVDHIEGDRRLPADVARLAAAGEWDATIDTSADEPADVNGAIAHLGSRAGLYVLISTVSAYHDWPGAPVDEESPLWPSRPDVRESDPDVAKLSVPFQYGVLKAGCELSALTAPGGCLIVRPGVILGPGEYVGRMLTLLGRSAAGGRWLVPSPPAQPIQPVDVRDVSRFLLDRVEQRDANVYNLTAPPGYGTYGDLVRLCVEVTGGIAEPVWVDSEWLVEQGVEQWTEIPLWRTAPGTWAVDSSRALQAGFACRPLAETVVDTFRDFQFRSPVPHPRQAEHGLSRSREAALLDAWDARASSGR